MMQRRTLSEAQEIEYATDGEVLDAMADWTDQQVQCRIFRHVYGKQVVERHKDVRSATITRECECGTRKVWEVSIVGERVRVTGGPWIDYSEAKGYLIKGMHRIPEEGRELLRYRAFGF
jgi:hypothetical protein